MKSWIVPLFAASALALGACATTTDESAALTPDQMKAELASVSQEVVEINARVQAQVVLGRDIRAIMQNRALAGRLMALVHRQNELRAQLAAAGYPRTAEEVRERIMEIDQHLAKRGQALAPAGSPSPTYSEQRLAFVSSSLTSPAPTAPATSPSPESAAGAPLAIYPRMISVPGASSPRSLDWQSTYRLKEERAALLAKLQTLERSEN